MVVGAADAADGADRARRSRRTGHGCARGVRHRVRPDRDTRLRCRPPGQPDHPRYQRARRTLPKPNHPRAQACDARPVQRWSARRRGRPGLDGAGIRAAGVSMKRRGAGFEEHILAMRDVWSRDPVSFEGRFYRIPEADIGPKPVRPDGPRLMAGAGSPTATERAGRLGVGLTLVIFEGDTIRETIETFVRRPAPQGTTRHAADHASSE